MAVLLADRVAVLLAAGVFEEDAVGVVLFVIVRVAVVLGVIVLETDGLGVPVRVIVLEIDGDLVIVFDTDGLGVSERVTVRVTETDFVIVLDTDGLGVSERVTVAVTEGDFVTDRVFVGVGVSDRVTVGVFVGVRLLENEGSFVGRRGIVGNAVVGSTVGRGGRVGNSVAGSSVTGSSVKMLGYGRILGYSVTGRIVGIVGRAVFTMSGTDGYSDLKISGTVGSSVLGSSVFRISGIEGYSGTDGISVRRLGIVSGMDPRIKLDGRSEGIAGIDGRTVVGISNGGSVGNAVEGIAGIESVGSIEGNPLINVAITPGMEGRAVNVRVGNGLGLIAPDAFADCDGRIGGIKDGSVNPPNCRLRSSLSAFAAFALSRAINPRSISVESILTER